MLRRRQECKRVLNATQSPWKWDAAHEDDDGDNDDDEDDSPVLEEGDYGDDDEDDDDDDGDEDEDEYDSPVLKPFFLRGCWEVAAKEKIRCKFFHFIHNLP